MSTSYYNSPLGPIELTGTISGLNRLRFCDEIGISKIDLDDKAFFNDVECQLSAYFSQKLRNFDIMLDPRVTSFQKKVLEALQCIPYGQTNTYGEIARKIGNKNASRAVGLANSRNPIAILIPCHRVIGANGKLTGFAYGLDRKQSLLFLEQNTY